MEGKYAAKAALRALRTIWRDATLVDEDLREPPTYRPAPQVVQTGTVMAGYVRQSLDYLRDCQEKVTSVILSRANIR